MATTPPAFFLDGPLGEGPPRLTADEASHAERVLRLTAGDELFGVDGAGGRWRLRVRRIGRGALELEPLADPEHEPPPGDPHAPLPWVEVAVAWPRRNRVEDMLSRLTQLGAAAITPLDAERRGPEPLPPAPPARWERVVREALKQSRRTWLPRLGAPCTPETLPEVRPHAPIALLDPTGGMSLDTWLRSLPIGAGELGTPERPVLLAVGPEGGFTDAERDALLESGATTCRLGPHILRVETAAGAAMAVAATVLERPRSVRDAP